MADAPADFPTPEQRRICERAAARLADPVERDRMVAEALDTPFARAVLSGRLKRNG